MDINLKKNTIIMEMSIKMTNLYVKLTANRNRDAG